jgi:predicted acylesterase/phospholipase RssA
VARRIRSDLPFRRVALVLSGGGALGAYEVGVFRALEAAGLEPRIVLGVSVGAINALIWVANAFRSAALYAIWPQLRPASVGIRWSTLVARALGSFFVILATLQSLLTLADVPSLGLFSGLQRAGQTISLGWHDAATDLLAWLVVAGGGLLLLRYSDRIDQLLVRFTPSGDPERVSRLFGRGLIAFGVLWLITLPAPFPWPHRVHLVALVFGALIWFGGRVLRRGGALKRFVMRTLPETSGRGLWRTAGRRRLIEGLLPRDADSRILDGKTRLIFTACEIESGRMHYFMTGSPAGPEFAARLAGVLGDAVPIRSRAEAIEAALASSAIPLVFEPVRIGTGEYVDGGVFSNQPLHAVLADGADAVMLVLVSPSGSPPRLGGDPHLMDFAGRLPQLANWRDLQSELNSLPPGWSRVGDPARLCVVEPEDVLPGTLLTFDPDISRALIERGERDAWQALESAHWLEG